MPLPFGDARFSKHSLSAAAFVPLLPDGLLSLGLSLSAGLLMPLGAAGSYSSGAQPTPSCISDRFFLGGANSFRGFRTHGLGPREPRHAASGVAAAAARGASARDAVGGEVMNVATVSLSAPLAGAKLRDAGVRAHLFSSVGGLHAMRTLRGEAGTSAEVAANLMRGTRVCVGAGLLVPTPMGRMELSLTKVLKRQGQDATQRSGWQLGLSGKIV